MLGEGSGCLRVCDAVGRSGRRLLVAKAPEEDSAVARLQGATCDEVVEKRAVSTADGTAKDQWELLGPTTGSAPSERSANNSSGCTLYLMLGTMLSLKEAWDDAGKTCSEN